MSTLLALLEDLKIESDELVDFLQDLDASDWDLPSAADGWSVRDQVSHLAFFDDAAVTAATEPERFKDEAAVLWSLGPTFPDVVASRYHHLPAPEVIDWFGDARGRLLSTFETLDGAMRVPWFGPDMSVMSSATARFMETWAHGLDIAETFGRRPVFSRRLRHIAHLGVRTRSFSFALRELPVPADQVYVELDTPEGERWVWGDPASENSVRGSALDFCLLVTQRRNRLDTDLTAIGAVADSWLSIAQAFAGAPSSGRPALTSKV